jgi:cytochrome c-type biogenesis protein
VGTGVAYLLAFSLGLGLPFLLAGVFFSRITGMLNRIKRFLPLIKTLSGILLVVIGLLIAFGRLQQLFSSLLISGARLSVWDASNGVLSGWLFGAGVFLVLSLPIIVSAIRRSRGVETARPLSWANVTLAAGGLAIGILNVTRVVSVAGWFSAWFQYTGL